MAATQGENLVHTLRQQRAGHAFAAMAGGAVGDGHVKYPRLLE